METTCYAAFSVAKSPSSLSRVRVTFLLAHSPELALRHSCHFAPLHPDLAVDPLGGQYFRCLVSHQNRECTCMLSRALLFVTPRTVACQAPQEYWSGLPFPSLGNLPDPGIEPESPVSSSLAGGFFTTSFLESPQAEREFMMPLYFRSFLGRLVKFLRWREGPI